MDSDTMFVLILCFLVVVIPVTLGVGSSMLSRWLKHKERTMELMADKAAEQAAQYAAKAERLEQRVRVLERIATDRGADLAQQIEDLRDVQARAENRDATSIAPREEERV